MGSWPQEFDDLLRSHCRFVGPGTEIDPGASLPELGMDSLEVVELIVELEDCFAFTFPESLLTPQVFATPGTIWEAISPHIPAVADDERR